jgi:hypothetical protein
MRIRGRPISAARIAGWLRRQIAPTRQDRLAQIPGWTHPVQLEFLTNAVRALPDGSRIVEVGVWQGRSALTMADACRGTTKRVYAVDPWADYIQDDAVEERFRGESRSHLRECGVGSFEEVYRNFLRFRARLGLEAWCIPVRAASAEAAGNWVAGPVSLLFIDGNHDRTAVTADLEVWARHLTSASLVCGDDWIWPSVREAVTAYAAAHGHQVVLPCANTWSFRPPDVSTRRAIE